MTCEKHLFWTTIGTRILLSYRSKILSFGSLRVPKYGVILEMVNFTFLLLFFVLCLSRASDIIQATSRCLIFTSISRKRHQDIYDLGTDVYSLLYGFRSWGIYSIRWTWMAKYVIELNFLYRSDLFSLYGQCSSYVMFLNPYSLNSF